MDNPETPATLDTQGEDKKRKKNSTTQKSEKMRNTDPPKTGSEPRRSRKAS